MGRSTVAAASPKAKSNIKLGRSADQSAAGNPVGGMSSSSAAKNNVPQANAVSGKGNATSRDRSAGPVSKMCREIHGCFVYFEHGNCSRGATCPYKHQSGKQLARSNSNKGAGKQSRSVSPGARKEPCKFYLKGNCASGSNCKFVHPKPCFVYQKGSCTKDKCPFAHIKTPDNAGRGPGKGKGKDNKCEGKGKKDGKETHAKALFAMPMFLQNFGDENFADDASGRCCVTQGHPRDLQKFGPSPPKVLQEENVFKRHRPHVEQLPSAVNAMRFT